MTKSRLKIIVESTHELQKAVIHDNPDIILFYFLAYHYDITTVDM